MTYRLTDGGVLRSDGASIPADPRNVDWQRYQEWLAEGNRPQPADPPPTRAALSETEVLLKVVAELTGRTEREVVDIFESKRATAVDEYPKETRR